MIQWCWFSSWTSVNSPLKTMIISSRAAAEQALGIFGAENLWKTRNSLVDFDMDYKYTFVYLTLMDF